MSSTVLNYFRSFNFNTLLYFSGPFNKKNNNNEVCVFDLFMRKLQQGIANFLVLYNTLKIIDQISNTFFYTKWLTAPVIKGLNVYIIIKSTKTDD